jgi:hypothetical protein
MDVMATQLRAIASFGDDPEKVEVVLPPGDVREMLSQVATKPQFQIYGMGLRYSYPSDVFAGLPAWPANTLVEAALPYCFHLPNGIQLEVRLPGVRVASVVLRKVWTDLAENSSEADFYATDRITYHNPTQFQTPTFPEKPELGPVPRCRGVNIERDRDTSGIYRYTRAHIFFDTDYPPTIADNQGEFARAEEEVVACALRVVNRLIDVYRLRTASDYIQRLPGIHTTDLFFRAHNIGSHGASFGQGIRSAIMNRSENEIREIAELLASGAELPVPDLLMLDAEASLESNRYTLAVVHAFQALELFLEEFLRGRLAAAGFDAQGELDAVWRTKERLRDLVRKATARSLLDDRDLWDEFCTVYDQTRNHLIHAARDLDAPRTRAAVDVCRKVINWLKSL